MDDQSQDKDYSGRDDELLAELAEFNKERERIRHAIGEIGGTKYSKIDNVINAIFLSLVSIFFVLEILQIFPANISLEISILLVSVKIVWMIHSQQKYNHFMFWILNSIEFRINENSRRLRDIEKKLGAK